ncbi:MAG: phenylacetate-CoA oxygenase subunit PaaI, partial [Candidatus Kapabacteria bacterium]|nr:phenylacetate-CoA oxygenase subunit PaaI [Candidatus Kapabacteria bacterium]
REQWLLAVRDVLDAATLSIPDTADAIMGLGGRKGYHTEHLQPMITEMTEVFRIDPSANW